MEIVPPAVVRETREQRPTRQSFKPPYPRADRAYQLELERLKAKRLGERLLHKKWARTGQLEWGVMQRLGDYGRKHFAMLGQLRSVTARYMPVQARESDATNAGFVWYVACFVGAIWFGFAQAFGSWRPWEW